MPEELARRESRLKKIQEAKAALEREAAEQSATRKRQAQGVSQKKRQGPPPQAPRGEAPDPKQQRNFTDPDSRIMFDTTTKGFEQAYSAQVAVDGTAQVIVAAAVTQEGNDKQQLEPRVRVPGVPMVAQVIENVGRRPKQVLADAGYFSEAAVSDPSLAGMRLYVSPDKDRHGCQGGKRRSPVRGSATERMRRKLRTAKGRAIYRLRKAIAEPPLGQIKEVRKFRRFLLRGLPKTSGEWMLISLTHNLLPRNPPLGFKLWRAGPQLAPG